MVQYQYAKSQDRVWCETMHEVVTKQQCNDDLKTLMEKVQRSWGWFAPFETKRCKEFDAEFSTDYIIVSNHYAVSIGHLLMAQVEDFFLLLAGEERGFNKKYIDCDYTNGNIPLKYYWTNDVPHIIKPNEFLMIPAELSRSVLEEKFNHFDAEQRNHANVPPANYFRKSKVVPYCKGFATWMKQWKDETAEEHEYRILAISLLYANHIRKNQSKTSSHQQSLQPTGAKV